MESFYVYALWCVGEYRGETCRRDCQRLLFWKLDPAKHKVLLPLQFPAQYEHTMALSRDNFGISAHGWTRISSSLLYSWWFTFFLVVTFFIQPIPIPIWFSILLLSGQDSSQTCSKLNVQSHLYLPFAKTTACSPVQVQCTLKVRVYVFALGLRIDLNIDLYFWNLIGYVTCSKHF